MDHQSLKEDFQEQVIASLREIVTFFDPELLLNLQKPIKKVAKIIGKAYLQEVKILEAAMLIATRKAEKILLDEEKRPKKEKAVGTTKKAKTGKNTVLESNENAEVSAEKPKRGRPAGTKTKTSAKAKPESSENAEVSAEKPKRGRPAGTKTKTSTKAKPESKVKLTNTENTEVSAEKPKRGRPAGSTNKPKVEIENKEETPTL